MVCANSLLVSIFATPRSPILTSSFLFIKMLRLLISLCRILFLWMYYRPKQIEMNIFQILSYFRGRLFCILRNWFKSPLSQYSMTMLSVLSSMKDYLYLTMKGCTSLPIMVASLMAWILNSVRFFWLFRWAFLNWSVSTRISIWWFCWELCRWLHNCLNQAYAEYQSFLFSSLFI